MKKVLLFALPMLAMLAVSCKKDNSTLPEPDGNTDEIIEFKDPNFLKVLLTCECAFIESGEEAIPVSVDFNNDGKISVSEAQKIMALMLCDYKESYGISDISEIKYFTNLEALDCTDNKLTSIDVSNNAKLVVLNCVKNQLTSLDVSNNVALKGLDCSRNQLTNLDLSANTLLNVLLCEDNKLTKIILPTEHSIPDHMIKSIIEEYGDIIEGGKPETGSKTYTDLSLNGTANCYVVSMQGDYKFKAVKGNTDVSVGKVNSAEVLWESFGTDVLPDTGDIIASASFEDGYICFSTPDISSDPLKVFPKGNAVIAAKDSDGRILWSWHIWLADFEEQVYYNGAGTFMDRNLGAVSNTPGDVGCLGLMYQWGRKDPFLGSSSISERVQAASTGNWYFSSEDVLPEDLNRYLVQYPTTFYTNDETLMPEDAWTAKKTMNDPCPVGWKVPSGGEVDVWVKALGISDAFEMTYDSTNNGVNFSGKLGDDSVIWYPASGDLSDATGKLTNVGVNGQYWSSYGDINAYNFLFSCTGYVLPARYCRKYCGGSVRCVKE